MTTTAPANRGKVSEKLVKEYLKKLESIKLTSYRFPDARSGSFQTAPCDFMILKEGKLTLLEVKEVQHKFRLPYGNYSIDQCARMRNFLLAGANACVAIYFAPYKVWRYDCITRFMVREQGCGSWDLSLMPVMSLDEMMKEILC